MGIEINDKYLYTLQFAGDQVNSERQGRHGIYEPENLVIDNNKEIGVQKHRNSDELNSKRHQQRKLLMKLTTWNVQGIKTEQVEVRKKEEKRERAIRGVSIEIHQKLKKCVKLWKEIDKRIILREIKKNGHEVVLIVPINALRDDSSIESKEEFYQQLMTRTKFRFWETLMQELEKEKGTK
ncbi:hypothetical protein ILUMI_08099 [Ignelater luminosus]|uniref:Uncharacterized protein n=1 Tax=Ignelater luminosus TaxID=2038154 RepID=A0A8K0D696_IGNLU|nr:hypothetical protein ILUMI_08099 [Ignelater luminosus]